MFVQDLNCSCLRSLVVDCVHSASSKVNLRRSILPEEGPKVVRWSVSIKFDTYVAKLLKLARVMSSPKIDKRFSKGVAGLLSPRRGVELHGKYLQCRY